MGRKGNAKCSIEGCEKRELARRWCSMHYWRWKKTGNPGEAERRRAPNGSNVNCVVEGCETPAHARKMCPAHLNRWRLYGDPLGTAPPRRRRTVEELRELVRRGEITGGTTSPDGYRYHSIKGVGRFAEHRLMMEARMGRALLPDETVHHKNGDRGDNRIENLELWSSSHPPGQRVADKVAWAREILARYADLPSEAL